MKNLLNIEKSGFHRGEYVGYGGGTVWRVYRHAKTVWYAVPRDNFLSRISASTLAGLSTKLEGLK